MLAVGISGWYPLLGERDREETTYLRAVRTDLGDLRGHARLAVDRAHADRADTADRGIGVVVPGGFVAVVGDAVGCGCRYRGRRVGVE